MTRRIKDTNPRLLNLLNKTIGGLLVRYPQLSERSKYRILFERIKGGSYKLSFWGAVQEGAQSKRRIEIPYTRVTEDQWFNWAEGVLTDNFDRLFEVPLNPFMSFVLTFAVVETAKGPTICLKKVELQGFHDPAFVSELTYETTTCTT